MDMKYNRFCRKIIIINKTPWSSYEHLYISVKFVQLDVIQVYVLVPQGFLNKSRLYFWGTSNSMVFATTKIVLFNVCGLAGFEGNINIKKAGM